MEKNCQNISQENPGRNNKPQNAENEKADAQVLKWILGKYNRAKRRKKQLDDRLERLLDEHNNPLHSPTYTPMPRSQGEGDGAVGILFRIAEIEDRIIRQRDAAEKAATQVMDILDYLPESSIEREIMELRYLDGLGWSDVSESVYLSDRQCYRLYKAALKALMQAPRVRRIVDNSRDEFMRVQSLGQAEWTEGGGG